MAVSGKSDWGSVALGNSFPSQTDLSEAREISLGYCVTLANFFVKAEAREIREIMEKYTWNFVISVQILLHNVYRDVTNSR